MHRPGRYIKIIVIKKKKKRLKNLAFCHVVVGSVCDIKLARCTPRSVFRISKRQDRFREEKNYPPTAEERTRARAHVCNTISRFKVRQMTPAR